MMFDDDEYYYNGDDEDNDHDVDVDHRLSGGAFLGFYHLGVSKFVLCR